MGLIIKQVELTKMEELEKIQMEIMRLTQRMGEILSENCDTNFEEPSRKELSPTRTMKFKANLLEEEETKPKPKPTPKTSPKRVKAEPVEEEPEEPKPKPTPKTSPKRVKAEPVEEESEEPKPKPTPKTSPKRVKAEPVEEEPEEPKPKPTPKRAKATMKQADFDIDKIFPENTASKYQSIGRFIAKRIAGEEICGWRSYNGQNKGMICCLPATKNDSGLFRCGEGTCVRNMKCSGDSILQELIDDHSDEKLSEHFSSDEEIRVMKMLLENVKGNKSNEKKI